MAERGAALAVEEELYVGLVYQCVTKFHQRLPTLYGCLEIMDQVLAMPGPSSILARAVAAFLVMAKIEPEPFNVRPSDWSSFCEVKDIHRRGYTDEVMIHDMVSNTLEPRNVCQMAQVEEASAPWLTNEQLSVFAATGLMASVLNAVTAGLSAVPTERLPDPGLQPDGGINWSVSDPHIYRKGRARFATYMQTLGPDAFRLNFSYTGVDRDRVRRTPLQYGLAALQCPLARTDLAMLYCWYCHLQTLSQVVFNSHLCRVPLYTELPTGLLYGSDLTIFQWEEQREDWRARQPKPEAPYSTQKFQWNKRPRRALDPGPPKTLKRAPWFDNKGHFRHGFVDPAHPGQVPFNFKLERKIGAPRIKIIEDGIHVGWEYTFDTNVAARELHNAHLRLAHRARLADSLGAAIEGARSEGSCTVLLDRYDRTIVETLLAEYDYTDVLWEDNIMEPGAVSNYLRWKLTVVPGRQLPTANMRDADEHRVEDHIWDAIRSSGTSFKCTVVIDQYDKDRAQIVLERAKKTNVHWTALPDSSWTLVIVLRAPPPPTSLLCDEEL